MKKIIFFGATGVGKSTVAKLVIDHLKIPQISTGDFLREAVKQGTRLGKKAKLFMDSGQLVPDELMTSILKQRIVQKDCENGFILDGFPRTIPQAEALDSNNIQIDKAIYLKAPTRLIIQRLSGRRTCKKCGAIFHLQNIPPKKEGICDKCGSELSQRDDDNPANIENRLKVYEEQTAPLIEFYNKKGNLVEIDASKGLTVTVGEILEALGE